MPITKEEVRAITISKMRLKEGFTAIDVGCGSGSLTVEICNQIRGGVTYAIDFDEKAVELTRLNLSRFGFKAEVILSDAQVALAQASTGKFYSCGGDMEQYKKDYRNGNIEIANGRPVSY